MLYQEKCVAAWDGKARQQLLPFDNVKRAQERTSEFRLHSYRQTFRRNRLLPEREAHLLDGRSVTQTRSPGQQLRILINIQSSQIARPVHVDQSSVECETGTQAWTRGRSVGDRSASSPNSIGCGVVTTASARLPVPVRIPDSNFPRLPGLGLPSSVDRSTFCHDARRSKHDRASSRNQEHHLPDADPKRRSETSHTHTHSAPRPAA